MISPLAMTAKKVIEAAWLNGPTYDMAVQAAEALESAQLLQSPDLAAEHEQLRTKYAEAAATAAELVQKRGQQMKVENALRDEAEELRARVAELEAQRDRRRDRLIALQNDALNMRGSLAPADGDRKVPFELGETLTPAVDWLIARVAELEAAQGTVYRAAHDVIVMGLYRTAAEARKHCETEARQTEANGAVFDWIEDEEDGVAELVAETTFGEEETGYTVTALEVAAEYDEEADQ
ncbi:hypothetical protein [Streptomyces tendae]|uniref:hypothetical protein n=1 Tax=Streptomyces tendae TaxID=1932 RepID=UPI0037985D37